MRDTSADRPLKRGRSIHNRNRVAILDAGGQYVDMVQKAVRRQGIPADVLPLNTRLSKLEKSYGAIIISGSPASSHHEAAPQPDTILWKSELPLLGICYGMQAMVLAQGGAVATNAIREDGRITTRINNTHKLFKGIKTNFTGLFTHGDFVTKLPKGYKAIGQHTLSDGMTAYSAVAKGNKAGVQFHPEVFDDTPEGYQLFKNFLFEVAGLTEDESFREAQMEQLITQKQAQIARQVSGRHVIAFVSGGVDSSVAAVLASKVIPTEQFHAFYIDNGFMRDEDDMVINALQAAGILVTKVDAVERFEAATAVIDGTETGPLIEATDPEAKRKIIGRAFIDVQNDILRSLSLSEALLLQGTNAADRIESGGSKGDTHTMIIKTHHNQVKEVQELKARGLLVEPIDDLFKDEIRAVGHELGLPYELVERQPFPGPGLAIRIIAAPEDKVELPKDPAEQALTEFVAQHMFEADRMPDVRVLPIRSVGVGGDERSHLSVAAIGNAGLTSNDLAVLATDIPAHFRGAINRVIYAMGPQLLTDQYVTKTLLTGDVREVLRHADTIVFEEMRTAGLLDKIKQMPVILLPISFGSPGKRSIVLRPVNTSTFMTVQAMLPDRDLPPYFYGAITARILSEVPNISQVFLDITNKPPATTEWE